MKNAIDNFVIKNATQIDISSVLNILNKELGKDYVTDSVLFSFMKKGFCKVIVEKNTHVVVGVCLFDILDYKNVTQITIGQKIEDFKNTNHIGFIKTIAVQDKCQNLGLGTKLLKTVLDALNKKEVDKFISTAWEHSGVTNISSLLKKFGFVEKFKIRNYWYEDSLKKKYLCPVCGNPCHCNCVVYIK